MTHNDCDNCRWKKCIEERDEKYNALYKEFKALNKELAILKHDEVSYRSTIEHLKQRQDSSARSLTFQVAQLRHAYTQLNAGTVFKQKEFANGLISPVIKSLETIGAA